MSARVSPPTRHGQYAVDQVIKCPTCKSDESVVITRLTITKTDGQLIGWHGPEKDQVEEIVEDFVVDEISVYKCKCGFESTNPRLFNPNQEA